jgi:hypothetical protein
MSTIDELFAIASETWLDALPMYQQKIITQLLSEGLSPEDAATRWLSASIKDTFPFGGVRGGKPFLERVVDELEAFLCGDTKYETERAKLLAEAKPTQLFVVSVISLAIAPIVGASAVFLAPAISLLLITVTKLGLNAWCTMRKETKDTITKQLEVSTEASSQKLLDG